MQAGWQFMSCSLSTIDSVLLVKGGDVQGVSLVYKRYQLPEKEGA